MAIGSQAKTSRNKKIMEYREKEYTLRKIAAIMQISHVRVSQIIEREKTRKQIRKNLEKI